ncbi:MAG: hypothetical protein QOH44_1305, partial [Actinomycetota bacterium]|nr:hypothetical protein [Actinomycetota bacterium]
MRKVSIRQSGAVGEGSIPGCQCQDEMRLMTLGSLEMMLTG